MATACVISTDWCRQALYALTLRITVCGRQGALLRWTGGRAASLPHPILQKLALTKATTAITAYAAPKP